MTDEFLPPPKPAPEAREQLLRDAAARAFAAAATEAKQPAGRARSIWRRRVEPWLLALAAIAFIGWALARVFLSR